MAYADDICLLRKTRNSIQSKLDLIRTQAN